MAKVKSTLSSDDVAMTVDLMPYTNQGCYTVQEHAVAMRCYNLFRTMGLRHLPVLRTDHTVSGMLTRKDLLAAMEHRVQRSKKSRDGPSRKFARGKKYRDVELASVIGADAKDLEEASPK